MYTVKELIKKFNLSRSTLLYYDKVGLLRPSARSATNYRLYSNDDIDKMKKIMTYREAGVSLKSIADIVNSQDSKSVEILENRLNDLNKEISKLRSQQQLVVSLLGHASLLRKSKVMNKQQWVQLLKSSGMDDKAMHAWHINFEKSLPEAHTDFLESLGINQEEIKKIKSWSQAKI